MRNWRVFVTGVIVGVVIGLIGEPTAALRGLLPRLAAERRPYRSRPVGKLPPHVVPGNRRSRVGEVLCPTPIEFCALLRPEPQLSTSLLIR